MAFKQVGLGLGWVGMGWDGRGMILLDRRDTGHLHRSLNSTAEEESAERRPVLEQLGVGLGLILMFKGDALLDLGVFGLHPGIKLVSVSVQLSKSLETLIWAVVVNQPTGRLRVVREGYQAYSIQESHLCIPRGKL